MKTNPSAIELTRQLLAFNTMQPEGSEKACAEHVAGILESAGFKISLHEFDEGRTTLVAELEGPEGSLPICFAGHLDTVPLGTQTWQHDPFKGEIENNRIYGRGTTDMKAGMAAATVAALRSTSIPDRKAGIKLIYTAGEEHGCKGTLHLAETGAAGRAGALVVPEPTSNHPACCHRGALWTKVTARGTTAHGALPHLGDNAIYKVTRMIDRVRTFDFGLAPHVLLGPPTVNVGTVSGGQNVNSVPDHAMFTIDMRTIPGQSHAEILEGLREMLGADATVKPLVDLEPVYTNPEHPWLQEVRRIAEDVLDTDLPPCGKLAFTDAAALTPAFDYCPTVILGPGIQEMCHKTDEYCEVSRIEESVEIYARLIDTWCRTERVQQTR